MADYINSSEAFKNYLGKVAPKDCAVIAIDITGDIANSPAKDDLVPATKNAAAIASAARKAGVPVIFTNDAHIEGIDPELALWGPHGIAGSKDAQTAKEMDMQATDYEIKKSRYSAFFQTSLRLLLDELHVSTLILVGFDTNICVSHTAADAFYNGYNIVVADDATATFLIGTQDEGLDFMKTCYGANIESTEDIIKFLSK